MKIIDFHVHAGVFDLLRDDIQELLTRRPFEPDIKISEVFSQSDKMENYLGRNGVVKAVVIAECGPGTNFTIDSEMIVRHCRGKDMFIPFGNINPNHHDTSDEFWKSLRDLLEIGEEIFAARWTLLDGQGRPAATGAGAPTNRNPLNNIPFVRTSGPDATSCADCHHQPMIGGAGGFVANVFVLAQVLDPVTDSVSAEFSNERNTLGMNGSGAIEMLAREMTVDLQALRQLAERVIQSGVPTNQFITRKLWDVGNTAPYGHRGDLTTITEAILHHAGEARPQRERFAALPKELQNEIVEFLKQLQVLPNGAPREITDRQLKHLLRNR